MKTVKLGLSKEKTKKQGGQLNHPGKTPLLVEFPDIIIEHRSTHCQQCGQDLNHTTPT